MKTERFAKVLTVTVIVILIGLITNAVIEDIKHPADPKEVYRYITPRLDMCR